MSTASGPITVLIADDHPLMRRGVAGVLDEESDLILAGQAADATEAVRLARERLPDVVLLDIHMPGDGLEALRILKQCTSSRVLMLTVSDLDDDLLSAIAAGADGYILKKRGAGRALRGHPPGGGGPERAGAGANRQDHARGRPAARRCSRCEPHRARAVSAARVGAWRHHGRDRQDLKPLAQHRQDSTSATSWRSLGPRIGRRP